MIAGPNGSRYELRLSAANICNMTWLGIATIQATVESKRANSLTGRKQETVSTSYNFPFANQYWNDTIYGRQYYDTSRLIGTVSVEPLEQYTEMHIELHVTFSTVDISSGPPPLSSDASTETKLRKMIASLLAGDEVTDTKFFLMSERLNRQACGPRALFANAASLRGKSDELDACGCRFLNSYPAMEFIH